MLDSAVAYVMDRVDFALVGSEAVVESGGLINYVGSNQMAIIAKAANKPFYALAERWVYRAAMMLFVPELLSHCTATSSTACFPYRSTIFRLTIRTSCLSLLRQGSHLVTMSRHLPRPRTPRQKCLYDRNRRRRARSER